MPPTLLLAEDEPNLAFSLGLNLRAEGYTVADAADGEQALAIFEAQPLDGVILDVMMPRIDGFAVAEAIRRVSPGIGILMLTARAAHHDRVHGLSLGADDYLTKPFALDELLLRVRRMVQRAPLLQQKTLKDRTPCCSRDGRVELDSDQLTLRCGERVTAVTQLEAALLSELIRSEGEVLSRERLLGRVWGMHHVVETRTVDAFMVRLRRYLGEDPRRPRYLWSVRGRGYVFRSL